VSFLALFRKFGAEAIPQMGTVRFPVTGARCMHMLKMLERGCVLQRTVVEVLSYIGASTATGGR